MLDMFSNTVVFSLFLPPKPFGEGGHGAMLVIGSNCFLNFVLVDQACAVGIGESSQE
jgi:hypothetical protein